MIPKKFLVYIASNLKVQKINSSNEQKKFFNASINFTFDDFNRLINNYILSFKKLKKTIYKNNIDRGNNNFFIRFLRNRVVDIIYNFCSHYDKKRLLFVYVISKIKNYNHLFDKLEMNFGKFLYKSGFPFSNEYKKKYSDDVIIEEELKFPNFKIYLDKLRQKKKSKRHKIIEKIPDYEENIKKFNLNVSEISANNNINNDYINELIKKSENQMNDSENSTFNNTNDNFNNNNNDYITEYESVNSISIENCQEQVDNNSINRNCENYGLFDENYERNLFANFANLYLKKK